MLPLAFKTKPCATKINDFQCKTLLQRALPRCCRHSGSAFDGKAWQKVIFIWWKQPFNLIH